MPATTVQIGNRTIPLDHERLGRLRPTALATTDDDELRRRLADDGYLYLKDLIPREAVLAGQVSDGNACRSSCIKQLAAAGFRQVTAR